MVERVAVASALETVEGVRFQVRGKGSAGAASFCNEPEA
jgi:hypothetical protein